jgi:hypothetical protein
VSGQVKEFFATIRRMDILLATNNQDKVERFRKLLPSIHKSVELHLPAALNIAPIEVIENRDSLLGNATLKAQAYFGKTDLPILANDTGFWVQGEGFIEAPKRTALGATSESELSPPEVAKRLLEYWKNIATKHGGEVDAAWVEVFVIMLPDGTVRSAESRREVILTNQEFGAPPLQMPVRALYRSKTTGKPAITHTAEEELLELEPITEALRTCLASLVLSDR